MIEPHDIKAKALRIWARGTLLVAEITGVPVFPLNIPFKKPGAREIQENFAEIQTWITKLREGSREKLGFGYNVEFSRINNRSIGEQDIPARIFFLQQDDFLRLLGKADQFSIFQRQTKTILSRQPRLRVWLEKNALKVLKYVDDWERLLAVCNYLMLHPLPNVYLREISIEGVDTKFIEERKSILGELLDTLLSPESINSGFKGLSNRNFEKRYGFKYEEPLIRFRLLDSRIRKHVGGIADLSIPMTEFAIINLSVRRVYIAENKINGLIFPDIPDSMVVFGLGYGAQILKEAAWLQDLEIVYWGDIDTHGFRILSKLRGFLPQTQSLMMDEATLLKWRQRWVTENPEKRYVGSLPNLNDLEMRVYDALIKDEFGKSIRLEQERISFAYVLDAIHKAY